MGEEVPAVVQYDFAVIGGSRGTGGFAGGNLFGNLFFGDAEHAGVDVIGYCRWGGRFFSALKSRFDGIYRIDTVIQLPRTQLHNASGQVVGADAVNPHLVGRFTVCSKTDGYPAGASFNCLGG